MPDAGPSHFIALLRVFKGGSETARSFSGVPVLTQLATVRRLPRFPVEPVDIGASGLAARSYRKLSTTMVLLPYRTGVP
jgi:hypothetical protein